MPQCAIFSDAVSLHDSVEKCLFPRFVRENTELPRTKRCFFSTNLGLASGEGRGAASNQLPQFHPSPGLTWSGRSVAILIVGLSDLTPPRILLVLVLCLSACFLFCLLFFLYCWLYYIFLKVSQLQFATGVLGCPLHSRQTAIGRSR